MIILILIAMFYAIPIWCRCFTFVRVQLHFIKISYLCIMILFLFWSISQWCEIECRFYFFSHACNYVTRHKLCPRIMILLRSCFYFILLVWFMIAYNDSTSLLLNQFQILLLLALHVFTLHNIDLRPHIMTLICAHFILLYFLRFNYNECVGCTHISFILSCFVLILLFFPILISFPIWQDVSPNPGIYCLFHLISFFWWFCCIS